MSRFYRNFVRFREQQRAWYGFPDCPVCGHKMDGWGLVPEGSMMLCLICGCQFSPGHAELGRKGTVMQTVASVVADYYHSQKGS